MSPAEVSVGDGLVRFDQRPEISGFGDRGLAA
jgi:hypothetical protein